MSNEIRWPGISAVVMSSENLDYEGSGANATIHGKYNNWIKNTEKDIAIGLSKACG